MKPKIIILNVLSMLAFEAFSQSSPTIIAAAGGTGVANDLSLEWTIGEPVSGSGSSATTMVTQGFEQPFLVITKITPALARPSIPVNSSVFPNPVSTRLNIKTWLGIDEKVMISLVDLQGNVLFSKQANAASDLQQIEMGKLPAAIYLLRITNIYGAVINTYRIVKLK